MQNKVFVISERVVAVWNALSPDSLDFSSFVKFKCSVNYRFRPKQHRFEGKESICKQWNSSHDEWVTRNPSEHFWNVVQGFWPVPEGDWTPRHPFMVSPLLLPTNSPGDYCPAKMSKCFVWQVHQLLLCCLFEVILWSLVKSDMLSIFGKWSHL